MNNEPTKRLPPSRLLVLVLLAVCSTACHFHGYRGGSCRSFSWCAPVRHCR